VVVRVGGRFGAESVDLHDIDPVGVGIDQRVKFGAASQLMQAKGAGSLRGIGLRNEFTELESCQVRVTFSLFFSLFFHQRNGAYSNQYPTRVIHLIKQFETKESLKYRLDLSLIRGNPRADLHPFQRSIPISPLFPLLPSQSSQWEVSSLPIDQLAYKVLLAETYVGS